MADTNQFEKIRIGIASPEDIKSWSHGEVKKPETINYRTFKPERDGLFCEKIFGPVKDWECSCGRYKKIKHKGVTCERCGVEVDRAKVRRERMGHVELSAPVCHIWYLKGVPSPLSLVLDISPRQLEKVIYFASFIIIDLNLERIHELLPQIVSAVEAEKLAIQASMIELEETSLGRLMSEMGNNPDEYFEDSHVRERMKITYDRIKAEYRDADERLRDLDSAAELLSKLEAHQLIDEDKWRAISRMLDSVSRRLKIDLAGLVHANIGADAVKDLLRKVDLERLGRQLKQEVRETTSQRRARAIKRLELVEAFQHSKSRPEWMILDMIPVISPELRPMVQLDGGRFATSDLNDLYRRIINRNNRLKKIIDIQAPESIINHEKRLLQESVDALVDNGRRTRPVVGSSSRPLKSLSDMLKGKEGRFRKNLLGKRVDYSGRSVIVVGPHLRLHQCGLPKEMALELFKPFVMKTLVEGKHTQNIKMAKRMIERMHPAVWDGLEKVIKEHPVLLNRAPTLHRLGIQAFEPVLVDGKAIQLHPLVCHAYNADFDGDQMAVHVPLSIQAQAEARVLMLSTQNLFSPADGRPVTSPIQDIVLGCYALTFTNHATRARLEAQEAKHKEDPVENLAPYVYSSPDEVLFHFESTNLDRPGLNDLLKVRVRRPVFRDAQEVDFRDPETGIEFRYETTLNETQDEIRVLKPLPQEFESVVVKTTPGRLLFNATLPYPMRYNDQFLSIELDKKAIALTITTCHKVVGVEGTIKLLDDMKALGFKWATKYGISIALTDMDPPKRRKEMLDDADNKAENTVTQYRRGRISFRQMQTTLAQLWTDTYDKIGKAIQENMHQLNPLSIITVSGARGSIKQLAQLSGMRGLMFNQFNEVIYELPVRNSFQRGLSMLEFFVTTHGARKGLADTALRTADAGYLTRRLVDVAQDMIIRSLDCGTTDGIIATRISHEGKDIEGISERIVGRIALSTVVDPNTEEVLTEYGEIVAADRAKVIDQVEKAYQVELEAATNKAERQKVRARYEVFGYTVDEHQRLGVRVRSPITCELEQGLCAKCYGRDLSTQKLVEVGVAVGIIAAQSIGEPGTQLTMRTFHMGGVAGAKGIARTNQYKTGKFVRLFEDDFKAATTQGEQAKELDPTKLLENQQSVIMQLFSPGLQSTEEVEEAPKKKVSARSVKAAEKAQVKQDTEARKMWEKNRKMFFTAWTGESSGIVRVEEIFEARRQPRGKAIISPLSGDVVQVERSSYGRWVVIQGEMSAGDPLKNAYISDQQDWEAVLANTDPEVKETVKDMLSRLIGQRMTTQTMSQLKKAGVDKVAVYYPILVPPLGTLPVRDGTHVFKGDALTEGPKDPHEVLELAGPHAVYEYFIVNLQSVYKDQGVDINDKHLEVIIRQMLRRRQVREPGDTTFLPGQTVDRFRFARENDRVRQSIAAGLTVKVIDPVSGEERERPFREATANWVLLGITEASLATDSFLSAASFQKTTRVLTEAAVRGKQDPLHGLKENVIIGRLIPAGTGVKQHRVTDITLDHTQPSWATSPLMTMAQQGVEGSMGLLGDISIEQLARQEEDEMILSAPNRPMSELAAEAELELELNRENEGKTEE